MKAKDKNLIKVEKNKENVRKEVKSERGGAGQSKRKKLDNWS